MKNAHNIWLAFAVNILTLFGGQSWAQSLSSPRARPLVQKNLVLSLQKYLLSAPLEQLAGNKRHLLYGAKTQELLRAAYSSFLTEKDIATFSQSVHPSVLSIFEKGAGLPSGYFLSLTRSVLFPGGNPFLSDKIPTQKQKQFYRKKLINILSKIVRHYRQRKGNAFPHIVQMLSGTSHLIAPQTFPKTLPKPLIDDKNTISSAVENIPSAELKNRLAYLQKFSPSQLLSQAPTRSALAKQQDLINFDHLMGPLKKQIGNKLLVEIYAENMPSEKKAIRFLPVTALGEGSYCIDDIARTIVALFQQYQRTHKTVWLKKAIAGFDFIQMMQTKNGEFYNFATVKNGKIKINKHSATSKKGTGFWAARALWAAGEGFAAFVHTDPNQSKQMIKLLKRMLPHLEKPLSNYGKYKTINDHKLPTWLLNNAADQTAIVLKGLLSFQRNLPYGKLKERVTNIITKYANGLAQAQITDPHEADYGRFLHNIDNPKDIHLWGSRQVEVLAEAGKQLKNNKWIEAAKLCANNYWGKSSPHKIVAPSEAQISYGIETVVSGYARLYEATNDKYYADQAFRWASWFFGNNKANAIMYDPISGRGYDGIDHLKIRRKIHYSVNINAGAESTVEALLAMQSADRVPGLHKKLRQFLYQKLPY